jgi:hypothetical protein
LQIHIPSLWDGKTRIIYFSTNIASLWDAPAVIGSGITIFILNIPGKNDLDQDGNNDHSF